MAQSAFDEQFEFITETHPGFTPEQMHIVRTWCRTISGGMREEGYQAGCRDAERGMVALESVTDEIQAMHDELKPAFYPERSMLKRAIERLQKAFIK